MFVSQWKFVVSKMTVPERQWSLRHILEVEVFEGNHFFRLTALIHRSFLRLLAEKRIKSQVLDAYQRDWHKRKHSSWSPCSMYAFALKWV